MKNLELFKNKILFNDRKIFHKKREIIYNSNFKIEKHFSGASPPEIFVGRYNYPNVNAGILSPNSFDNSDELSMPEIWYEKKFNIGDILMRRTKLIYGRFNTKIKIDKNKLRNLMQEIAMASKPIGTEMFLKNTPKTHLEINKYSSIITNFAPLENARLQENIKVESKVDYLISDIHVKANDAIKELYQSGVKISNINKLLSAGLLGLKLKRKLIPTRWSITAVDDNIGKELLKKVRTYKEIDTFAVFHAEYLGNHYEVILLPGNFNFEIIEADIKNNNINFWQDYESFYGRKDYAKEVVGGYYVARLATLEYLEKIKRQANVLILREITNDYYAHLGVGILREICRDSFNYQEKFDSLNECLDKIQERLNIKIDIFKEKSILLKNHGKQKRLSEFI